MIEKQELYCHECGQWVQFDLDMSMNGNHVLTCPNCGHEHCRVVEDGKITGDRWDSRNKNSYTIANVTFTNTSTFTTYISASSTVPPVFNASPNSTNSDTANQLLYYSWMNTTINT